MMNVKEFIQESLEYLFLLEDTENRIEYIKKQYPSISDKDIKELANLDPTENKKYLNWLAREYNKNSDEFNRTFRDIKKQLEIYNNPEFIKTLTPKNRNIMNLSFDKFNWLFNDINYNDYIKKEERKSKEELEKEAYIGDGEDYKIYKLKTYQQSKWLGQGTKWCTAANSEAGEEDFDSYNKRGPLYVFINKKDPSDKYQLNIDNTNNYLMFMDKLDKNILNTEKQNILFTEFLSSSIPEKEKDFIQDFYSNIFKELNANVKEYKIIKFEEFIKKNNKLRLFDFLNSEGNKLFKQLINNYIEYIHKTHNPKHNYNLVFKLILKYYNNNPKIKKEIEEISDKHDLKNKEYLNIEQDNINTLYKKYKEYLLDTKYTNLFDNQYFIEMLYSFFNNKNKIMYSKNHRNEISVTDLLNFDLFFKIIKNILIKYDFKKYIEQLIELNKVLDKEIRLSLYDDKIKQIYNYLLDPYLEKMSNDQNLKNELLNSNLNLDFFNRENLIRISLLDISDNYFQRIFKTDFSDYFKNQLEFNITFNTFLCKLFNVNEPDILNTLFYKYIINKLLNKFIENSNIKINAKNFNDNIDYLIDKKNIKQLLFEEITLDYLNLKRYENIKIKFDNSIIKKFTYIELFKLTLDNLTILNNNKYKIEINNPVKELQITDNDYIEEININANLDELFISRLNNLDDINVNKNFKINELIISYSSTMHKENKFKIQNKIRILKEQGLIKE